MGAPNLIDLKGTTIFHWAQFGLHAVAMARDVQANHALTEPFDQCFPVRLVIADIDEDQRLVIKRAINRRQRLSPGMTG